MQKKYNMSFFLEILKYILPSIIMLIGVYLIIVKFFEQNETLKKLELKKLSIQENRKVALPLRLQAYERVILFLERIHPNQLVQRVREPNMTVAALNLELAKAIRIEYEYNLSQQIYLNQDAWVLVERAKDETLKIINSIASNLPKEANGIELSKAIFQYLAESNQEFPTHIAINFIKEDVKNLF